MKNFFNKYGWLIIIIVLVTAFVGYIAIINRDFIFKLGDGNWILGLILCPFVLLAIITTVRGGIALFDKDSDLFQEHSVLSIIYAIAVFVGYAILAKLIF